MNVGQKFVTFVIIFVQFISQISNAYELIIPNIKDDSVTRYAVCSVLPDRGESCGPTVVRWYFDSVRQICRSFEYNGCGGNPNNFPTVDFCNSYCNRACPYDARPLKREDGGIKICNSQQSCPTDYTCTEVTVENLKTHYCCPTKYAICNQMPALGDVCAEESTRWYYSSDRKTCVKFAYKGCNGNSNNFNTSRECLSFCQSTACLPGENVLQVRNTIQTCDPNLGNQSCSDGYKCRNDPLYRRNICCGSKPRVCPEGSKPYVESGTAAEVRFCQVGLNSECPSPYICAPNLDDRINYCCAPLKDDGFCYEGQKVYRSEITSLPKVCRLLVPNDCPDGFKCTPMYEFAIEGYCCSGKTPDIQAADLDDFNYLFEDDVSDNVTFGFRNITSDFSNMLNDSKIVSEVRNFSRQMANKVANVATSALNSTVQVVNEVSNLAKNALNSSVQAVNKLANSGKEAFVNLITECADDSSCPIGFICQKNSTSKRANCMLFELASDFVPSDKFENESVSLKGKMINNNGSVQNFVNDSTKPAQSVLKQNLNNQSLIDTNFTIGPMNITRTVEKSNFSRDSVNMTLNYDSPIKLEMTCTSNDTCPVGQYCCSHDKTCCSMDNNTTTSKINMSFVQQFNRSCNNDSDCDKNASCVNLEASGSICIQDNLINTNVCAAPMKKSDGHLSFCTQSKPCPQSFNCKKLEQFGICCGVV